MRGSVGSSGFQGFAVQGFRDVGNFRGFIGGAQGLNTCCELSKGRAARAPFINTGSPKTPKIRFE